MILKMKPKVVYLHQVIDAFFPFPTFSIVKEIEKKDIVRSFKSSKKFALVI